MTTTGTATFNLSLVEIIEEAFERVGVELRTGYDLKTAQRSLNLLTIEWASKGINLWTVDSGSIAMVASQASYSLPINTIDLISHVIRTQSGVGQTDINISRISVDTYASIPNKNATGRPIQMWVDRHSGATTPAGVVSPKVTVWPTPDRSDYYTLVYWRLRRIQDAGNGDTTQDIPFRFLPCMVAGLAYYLSMKIPEAFDRMPVLKAVYDEQWIIAADEDREKSPLRVVPRMIR
jgi:hypothetical protein